MEFHIFPMLQSDINKQWHVVLNPFSSISLSQLFNKVSVYPEATMPQAVLN